MARGGKLATKCKTMKRIQSMKKGSDESDEDYIVGKGEEFVESEDDYCSSLHDDETDESLGDLEEEECVKRKIKKAARPRGRKRFHGRNGVVKPMKNNAAYSKEREGQDNDDFTGSKGRKKRMLSKPRKGIRFSSNIKNKDHCNVKPRKRARVSYREENEDSDCDDFDEDKDEEFTPNEVDGVDDDEELPVWKRNKVNRLRVPKAQGAKREKQRRKFKTWNRTKRKKSRKKQVVRRKNRNHAKELRIEATSAQKKKRGVKNGRGRRKSKVGSDSDFVTPGLSDYDHTISEEEREQIREASEFCRRLTTSLRSSSSLRMSKMEEPVSPQKECPERKGKVKVADMKIEAAKHVCGICLSEEGKRTVRGLLDTCSHYFCFACIMEWSKVESRCPLCKQRFATISRTTVQLDGGHDFMDVVIPVPERDQVYQPSEEELRGYLDPYENVLCTECHQGGDDAHMLLCDLCDSSAHTYCVGLGHEVPEGNWYCDGCRPTIHASSNAQAMNSIPDHGANNLSVGSSPVGTVRDTFDPNELYIPETPLTHVTGHSPSPRYSIGDIQAASGSGAFTLYERRRIQHQIHLLLNNRSRQSERSDGVAFASGIGPSGSQICQNGVAPQQAVLVQVARENIHQQGRLLDCNTPLCDKEVLPPRSISSRGQILHHQGSTSTDHSFSGLLLSELSGTTARNDHGMGQQLHHCNIISNTGANASTSLNQFGEAGLSSLKKEHVQSMVRSHLKSLSRNRDLGYITFKCIARASTHTILAAVGLEHRRSEVYPIQTRPLICDHLDSSASKPKYSVAGQCSSCFDWFIRNVVREIMSIRVPLLSGD